MYSEWFLNVIILLLYNISNYYIFIAHLIICIYAIHYLTTVLYNNNYLFARN